MVKKGLGNQKSNRSNYPRNSTISSNLLTVDLKDAIKFFVFEKLVHRNLFSHTKCPLKYVSRTFLF